MSTKKLTPINPPTGVATATLDLPDGLFWVNEFDWVPVAQTAIRGLTGTLHPHTLTRKGGGRPIELSADDDVWITRTDLKTLISWASIPAQKLTLWINGASFNVLFDMGIDEATSGITSSPLVDYSDIGDEHWHTNITLRFLTVE